MTSCRLICFIFLFWNSFSTAWFTLPSSPHHHHHHSEHHHHHPANTNRRQFFPAILPQTVPTRTTPPPQRRHANEYHHPRLHDATAAPHHPSASCAKCQRPLHASSSASSSSLGQTIIQTQQHDGKRYHAACFTCQDCGERIHGAFHSAAALSATATATTGEALYHPQCFKKRMGLTCDYCGHYLHDEWTEFEGGKYHPTCYTNFVQSQCVVCGQGLEGAWTISDPWGNLAHVSHGGQPTESCASCQRILTASETSRPLRDGRLVCTDCQATAVTSSAHISQALQHVLADLQSVLGGILEDVENGTSSSSSSSSSSSGGHHHPHHRPGWQGHIHIYLADRHALARKAQQAGCLAHSHGNSNFHGLTTTTRITTALRTIPQTFTTMEHEIVLLTHLPELQFRGVLAHELLHVWLNEAGITPAAAPELVEGFCNLGSWLVYQREAAAAAAQHHRQHHHRHNSNSNNAALATVLLQQLQQDPDAVYGDGYRAMKQVLDRSGWRGVVRKLLVASASSSSSSASSSSSQPRGLLPPHRRRP